MTKQRFSNFSSSSIYRLAGTTGDVKHCFFTKLTNKKPARVFTDEKEADQYEKENPTLHRVKTDTRTESAAFYSYIEEKFREYKLNRSINTDVNTRPIVWGKVLEMYVFKHKLGLEYTEMNERGRLFHADIENWCGVPDSMKNKTVVTDTKCPSSMVNFCNLVDDMAAGLEQFKKNQKEYYYQLVSNAILTGVKKAELIVYVPYEKDLLSLFNYVDNLDNNALKPLKLVERNIEFIFYELLNFQDGENYAPNIPYLPEGSKYKDLNKFEFDIPEADIKFLTQRVKKASELFKKKKESC